jgi:hypothetical protein
MKKFFTTAFVSAGLMVSCGTPTPPTPPTISITNSTDAFTKGTISIELAVTGAPTSVELLQDGAVLATLTAPYAYAWDTTTQTEKMYTLTARAKKTGTADVVSNAKQVTVDRTAPTVVSRLPVDEITNFLLTDEISVTFNEAILASSVNAANVQLKIGANVTSSTAALNAAATKITIVPTVLPTLIATISTVLNGVTDKAGNVATVASTNFTAPDWVSLGGSLNIDASKSALFSDIALDSSGNPIVTWHEDDGTSYNVHVKKWNGATWASLGGILDFNSGKNAFAPSIALDSSGNPTIAWQEPVDTSNNIYVKKWNGTTWTSLGGFLDVHANTKAELAAIALDSSGNPIVTWNENDGTSNNIYVKKWNGTTWVSLGEHLDLNKNAEAKTPSIVLDSSGNPIVTWTESDGVTYNIYVKKWNGTTWVSLGGVLDFNYPLDQQDAVEPSIVIDSIGNPIVAWREGGTTLDIYVKKWNGTTWVSLGGHLDFDVSKNTSLPAIAIDASGNPIVTWQENDGNTGNIYVKKWNGTTWISLGGIVDLDASKHAVKPAIALDSSGHPVISWHEQTPATNYQIRTKKLNRIP